MLTHTHTHTHTPLPKFLTYIYIYTYTHARARARIAAMDRIDLELRSTLLSSPTAVYCKEKTKFYESPEDVADLCRQIESHTVTTLDTLEFSGCSFSLEACQALAVSIGKNRTLKHALFDDMFTRRMDESIHPSLSLFSEALLNVGSSLTWLDFSDNAVK